MVGSRFGMLALGALVSLSVGPTVARADQWREASEQVVSAAGLRAFRAENPSGDIRVRPSADGRIHVTALKVIHADPADHDRLSRGTRVDLGNEQGVYVVRVNYPSRTHVEISFWDIFKGFELPRVEVQLGIELPPNLPVELSTSSGDQNSEGITAMQTLSSSSGDVTLQDCGRYAVSSASGDLFAIDCSGGTLRSTSGDVVVDGAAQTVRVRTASGDVRVDRAADSVRVETVSGDVDVSAAPRGLVATSASGEIAARRAAGRTSIESGSGDVTLELAAPLSGTEVISGSGDLTVHIPRGAGCALEARTSNGALDVELPLQVREVNRHQLTATVSGGGAPVTLRSSSGDIHVTSGGGK